MRASVRDRSRRRAPATDTGAEPFSLLGMRSGILEVHMVSAEGLLAADRSGTSDPYAKVSN